jgi:LPXTG-site transpeptidase (sortase) family protein
MVGRSWVALIALSICALAVRPAPAAGQVGHASTNPPVRLVAEAAGIDGWVYPFALNRDGTMPVPSTGTAVAWYTFSAEAGMAGNAVLAGHRDWQGRRGVFYTLTRLREGDEIWLQSHTSTWYQYRVTWTRSVPDDDAPLDDLLGDTFGPTLTLITCSGQFAGASRGYLDRQVVRAELTAVVGPGS